MIIHSRALVPQTVSDKTERETAGRAKYVTAELTVVVRLVFSEYIWPCRQVDVTAQLKRLADADIGQKERWMPLVDKCRFSKETFGHIMQI